MKLAFGEYFRNLIEGSEMSKTDICKEMGISRPYLYSVFAGEKTLAPDKQLAAVELLKLFGDQRSSFYDLAAKDRGEIPIDIVEILADEKCRRDVRMRYRNEIDRSSSKGTATRKSNTRKVEKCLNTLFVPCCYQGGKQRVAKEIVDLIYENTPHIDNKTHFYDVCCGSGAFTVELLNRGVNPNNITMIDVSSWGSFWKLIGSGAFEMSILDSYLNSIPDDKSLVKDHMSKLAEENALVDEQYKYILLQACSFGGKQIWRDGSIWKMHFSVPIGSPHQQALEEAPPTQCNLVLLR